MRTNALLNMVLNPSDRPTADELESSNALFKMSTYTNEEPDVCIIELGGTVGDIESGPFIEAMIQMRRRAGKDNFLQIHVSLVPVVSGEQKTKPTQQAIKDVRSAGLSPDLVSILVSHWDDGYNAV